MRARASSIPPASVRSHHVSASDLELDRLAERVHRACVELVDDPAVAFVAWADELGLTWPEGVNRAEAIADRILRAAHDRPANAGRTAAPTGTVRP